VLDEPEPAKAMTFQRSGDALRRPSRDRVARPCYRSKKRHTAAGWR
jgi:hypothetical protein